MPPTVEPPKTVQEAKPLPQPTQEVKTPPTPTVDPKTPPPVAFTDPLKDLEELANPTPKKVEEPKKEVEPAKEPDDKEVKQEAEAETLKKEGEEVKTERPAGTAKELRAALDSHKKQVQALKAELENLKKGKTEDPEKKTLLERLQQEEERRKKVEAELGTLSYEKTEEYKEKFIKPMEKAFKYAYEEVAQLKVSDGESTRPATKEDFQKLLYLNTGDAQEAAENLFGRAASEVMAYRRSILNLERDRKESLEFHQKNRSEIEAAQKIEQEKLTKHTQELWERTKDEQIKKYPQFFDKEEGDDEGNESLEKGYEFVDFVYSNPNLPIEKKIEYSAVVRNKAAAFDRLAIRLKRTSERVAELEKELEGYKSSTPGEGDHSADDAPKSTSWQDEIDALVKK